jgi:hypothetical protein
METMENVIPYFKFRVLLQFDGNYQSFVGYCLETGNVVTADDMDTASEMIREVLEEEISNAVKFANYSNLFSKPAPKVIWDRWYELSKTKQPETVFLNIRNERVNVNEQEQTPASVESVRAA